MIGLSKPARHIKCFQKRHAAVERALTSQLNCRAIGHRIGKGQAQFKNVHARARQAKNQLKRGIEIWIPGHDIRHKSLFPLVGKFLEFAVDASHFLRPF